MVARVGGGSARRLPAAGQSGPPAGRAASRPPLLTGEWYRAGGVLCRTAGVPGRTEPSRGRRDRVCRPCDVEGLTRPESDGVRQ